MAAVKLTYVKYRGRAELNRYLLSQASVKFEDLRLDTNEWAEKMPGTQFGKTVLEHNGTVLYGNMTVAKFLAENYNLTGCSEEEKQESLGIVTATEETWDKMASFFWEKDEEKKEAAKKDLLTVHLPVTLKKLEITAAKNGVEEGWIVGKQVTCADLAIAVLLEALIRHHPELLSMFSNLSKLKASVEGLSNIKKWIAERPDSEH